MKYSPFVCLILVFSYWTLYWSLFFVTCSWLSLLSLRCRCCPVLRCFYKSGSASLKASCFPASSSQQGSLYMWRIYINFIHVHVASNVHYYYIQLGTSCVLAGSPQRIWLHLIDSMGKTHLHPSQLLWIAAFSSPIQPCSHIQPQHYRLECLTSSLAPRKNCFRRWSWQHSV